MPENIDPVPAKERRRIVIPLGSGKKAKATVSVRTNERTAPQVVPRKRGGLGKVLALLGVLAIVAIVLVAGGIFLWWQHYKTTPAYSLAVLVDGAQRNDVEAVQSIVDIDKVVQNFAGEVTEKAASRYGLALGTGARGQIEALTPILLPQIKESVNTALTNRVKEISAKADHKPFVLIALGVPYLVNIVQSGDSAKATATIENQPVEVEMLKSTNGWRIVAYRDEALVQRAIDQVIKDLPAIGPGGDGKKLGKGLKGLPGLR